MTLADYLAVLRRHAVVALVAILIVPAAAFFVSRAQDPVYEASAQVLVRTSLAATLSGIPEAGEPERDAATQARLARVPAIARRVLGDVPGAGLSVEEFLEDSSVSASPTTDLLTFIVRSSDPVLATQMANAYAEAYTDYRQDLERQAITAARNELIVQIARLEAAGREDTPAYEQLTERAQQLSVIDALESSRAIIVERADQAEKVAPRPLRSAALGLGVGLLLAVGLVFAFEALDRRVRSVEEVERRLRRPILAEIPVFPRKIVKEGGVVTLRHPNSSEAEAFRILRTSFDFVNLEREARSVVVTSSVANEGKSVVAANLAVTLARAARRVVLVDLDVRDPSVAHRFDLAGRAGLTDVVLGFTPLEQALASVTVDADERAAAAIRDNGRGPSLRVLTLGRQDPPNPGEFVASKRVATLIAELGENADHVIIDTPPVLAFGDAAALTASTDGVVFVARLGTVKRPMLTSVQRSLAATSTRVLGIVVTSTEAAPPYAYTPARKPPVEHPSPAVHQ